VSLGVHFRYLLFPLLAIEQQLSIVCVSCLLVSHDPAATATSCGRRVCRDRPPRTWEDTVSALELINRNHREDSSTAMAWSPVRKIIGDVRIAIPSAV
jgi:hypothetical protein